MFSICFRAIYNGIFEIQFFHRLEKTAHQLNVPRLMMVSLQAARRAKSRKEYLDVEM